MINKVLTEEEMFEERLRRLDKQEYLDENEHRFILANIKACFRETIHQRDYIKQLESKIKEYENLMGTPIQDIMKRLKILEILKEHIAFKLDERQRDKYLIKMVSEDTGKYTYIRLYEEEVKKLLEGWLDGKD